MNKSMGKNDSVVMAVTKGDASFLRFSLAWLLPFQGQTVFAVDHISEAEDKRLRWFAERKRNVLIVEKTGSVVDNPAWSTFLFGTRFATGNRIFWTAPDLVWDAAGFDLSLKLPAHFLCLDAPNSLGFAYYKLMAKLSPWGKHYVAEVYPQGFPFQNFTWHSEEKAVFNRQPTFHKYDYPLIKHLRPTKNPRREYVQGILRRKLRFPLWRVLLHSLFYGKVWTLIGFLRGHE